jgi:hypothetical protein
MKPPAVVDLVRQGAALDLLEAAAAKLWLAGGGADPDGAIAASVEAFWRAQPGDDPYWAFLSQRMACDGCGDTSKIENLSICPNCFNTYCYRHGRDCECGHVTVG